MKYVEGGWKIISVFPDTEALIVKKLRAAFQAHGDALLADCLVSVQKPAPQEDYKGNVVVVARNGGGISDNGLTRDDIFTFQVWGFNYEDTAHITALAEGIFQTLYGDGILNCTIDEPAQRFPMEGEGFLRYFTGNVYVAGSSL